MEIILISNNLYENNLAYSNLTDLDQKKLTRPLSVEGENLAKEISLLEVLDGASVIYSSSFASSLSSAKYLANRIDKKILVDEKLNDPKVGILGNKSLSMIKFMQDHDFDIKLNNGESLTDVKNRMDDVISKIIYLNSSNKAVIYTHKRSILGFLLNHANVGYNLDDNLVLSFNDNVVFDEEEKDYNIIKLTIENKNIIDIEVIDI